jgi:hypothetical protein
MINGEIERTKQEVAVACFKVLFLLSSLVSPLRSDANAAGQSPPPLCCVSRYVTAKMCRHLNFKMVL